MADSDKWVIEGMQWLDDVFKSQVSKARTTQIVTFVNSLEVQDLKLKLATVEDMVEKSIFNLLNENTAA